MKKFILVILALFMMSSQVYAGPQVYGYGKKTCGRFVTLRAGHPQVGDKDFPEYLSFISWFSGFATYESLTLNRDVLYDKDADAITLWLENYCKEHPLDQFLAASIKLLDALKEHK